MTLSLIYARSEDHCIGKAGRIPWRLPDELAHFKRTTLGRPIIMGRRTYEDHQSALPGRLNIVVTSQPHYAAAEPVRVTDSLEEALKLGSKHADEMFVVGGRRLFELSFPLADRVYETVVHTRIPDGDTFVPAFDFSGWTKKRLQEHPSDARHAHPFSVYLYEKAATR